MVMTLQVSLIKLSVVKTIFKDISFITFVLYLGEKT